MAELDRDMMKTDKKTVEGGKMCAGADNMNTEMWTIHGPQTLYRQIYSFIGI